MNKYQKIMNKTVKNLRAIEKMEGGEVASFYKKRKKARILAKKEAILNRKRRVDYEILKFGQKNTAYALRIIKSMRCDYKL